MAPMVLRQTGQCSIKFLHICFTKTTKFLATKFHEHDFNGLQL